MQLRRGPPPPAGQAGDPPRAIRLLRESPSGITVARTAIPRSKWWDSYFLRVLAGALLVSIPVSVVLGFLVSQLSSQTSIQQAKTNAQATATITSKRITDWSAARQAELKVMALDLSSWPSDKEVAARVLGSAAAHPYLETIQLDNADGLVIATTRPDSDSLHPTGGSFTASLTSPTVGPILQTTESGKNGLAWVMSAPVIGSDNKPLGVVIADLYVGVLGTLLTPWSNAATAANHEVHLLDVSNLVLYSSDWGDLSDDSAIATKGGLSIRGEQAIADQALANGSGSAQFTDFRGHSVLAGYQSIPSLKWVVIASTDLSAALAPVYDQEVRTSIVQALGTVMIIGFAVVLARLATGPLLALSRAAARVEAGDLTVRISLKGSQEVRRLNGTFNGMIERLSAVLSRLRGEVTESATKLSAAAEQLAAATIEQTTAASATSASMEELARSSLAIADTIDKVAIQAGEVRSNLELAQTDLRASGDRTLALAGRVNEIEGILELINDIADQTNLLALNAAIEAARAGDAGRGFAVVADEVRRLAERSKASAGQIAKLVEGAQAQSGETVMALEKGVKQMERGLAMMQAMAEVSSQVQVATQQQRTSTEEVVRAIEHIAEGSHAVATTAQEIAAAAARQGQLAADLAGSGWERGGSGQGEA
jgi:methyl-accepting chemotaxis protein